MVVQLKKIIETGNETLVRDKITEFSCLDPDVENFLKAKAYQYEQRNKSRTYLVISEDGETLLAYFTLSLKTIEYNECVSKNIIKQIDGFNKNATSTPAVLIGQLGKNNIYTDLISGADLLNICLHYVYLIHSYVGGRIVFLESINNEKVLSFYKKNGFHVLREDASDKLIQMTRFL